MAFLVVVLVMLAVSYVGAMIHAKILLQKGDSDVETKITNTGASIMVLGVLISLACWPAGKAWYKSDLFAPAYKLSSQYLKANPKDIPKGAKAAAEAESYYVKIRQVLIGSLTSIICGILAQLIIKSQAKSIVGNSGSSAPMSKGPKSPWSGQSY